MNAEALRDLWDGLKSDMERCVQGGEQRTEDEGWKMTATGTRCRYRRNDGRCGFMLAMRN